MTLFRARDLCAHLFAPGIRALRDHLLNFLSRVRAPETSYPRYTIQTRANHHNGRAPIPIVVTALTAAAAAAAVRDAGDEGGGADAAALHADPSCTTCNHSRSSVAHACSTKFANAFIRNSWLEHTGAC